MSVRREHASHAVTTSRESRFDHAIRVGHLVRNAGVAQSKMTTTPTPKGLSQRVAPIGMPGKRQRDRLAGNAHDFNSIVKKLQYRLIETTLTKHVEPRDQGEKQSSAMTAELKRRKRALASSMGNRHAIDLDGYLEIQEFARDSSVEIDLLDDFVEKVASGLYHAMTLDENKIALTVDAVNDMFVQRLPEFFFPSAESIIEKLTCRILYFLTEYIGEIEGIEDDEENTGSPAYKYLRNRYNDLEKKISQKTEVDLFGEKEILEFARINNSKTWILDIQKLDGETTDSEREIKEKYNELPDDLGEYDTILDRFARQAKTTLTNPAASSVGSWIGAPTALLLSPTVTHRTTLDSIGCLSLQDTHEHHPDCSDSQLFILEGDNGSFNAVNYLKLQGNTRFLCFPVSNQHLNKLTDNIYADCSAVQFNKIIAQSPPAPVFRSLGGGGGGGGDDYCPLVGTVRADGSITFAVSFNSVEAHRGAAHVASALRNGIEKQLQNTTSDRDRKTLESGLTALEFGMDKEGEDAHTTLHTFLETLTRCIDSNMSTIVAMFPPVFERNECVLTFEEIRPMRNGRLEVPCLGLVHENETSVPVTDGDALAEHVNAVRGSYWVAALTAAKGKFDRVLIPHDAGQDIYNSIHIWPGSKLTTSLTVPAVVIQRKEYGSGTATVGFSSPETINEMRNQSDSVSARIEAVNDVRRKLLTEVAASMWPGKQLPLTERHLRVTNLALARVGSSPVATIVLSPSAHTDKHALSEEERLSMQVRDNLTRLARERNYTKRKRGYAIQEHATNDIKNAQSGKKRDWGMAVADSPIYRGLSN